jgi:hypothetical protein
MESPHSSLGCPSGRPGWAFDESAVPESRVYPSDLGKPGWLIDKGTSCDEIDLP